MSTTQYSSIAHKTAQYPGKCKKCGKEIVKGGSLFMFNGSRCADAACAATGPVDAQVQQPAQPPQTAPPTPAPTPQPAQTPRPAPAQQAAPPRPTPPNSITVSVGFDKIDTFAQIHTHAMNFARKAARDIYPGEKESYDRRITTSVIYNRAIDFVIHA